MENETTIYPAYKPFDKVKYQGVEGEIVRTIARGWDHVFVYVVDFFPLQIDGQQFLNLSELDLEPTGKSEFRTSCTKGCST